MKAESRKERRKDLQRREETSIKERCKAAPVPMQQGSEEVQLKEVLIRRHYCDGSFCVNTAWLWHWAVGSNTRCCCEDVIDVYN